VNEVILPFAVTLLGSGVRVAVTGVGLSTAVLVADTVADTVAGTVAEGVVVAVAVSVGGRAVSDGASTVGGFWAMAVKAAIVSSTAARRVAASSVAAESIPPAGVSSGVAEVGVAGAGINEHALARVSNNVNTIRTGCLIRPRNV